MRIFCAPIYGDAFGGIEFDPIEVAIRNGQDVATFFSQFNHNAAVTNATHPAERT